MNFLSPSFTRTVGLLAGVLLAVTGANAAEADAFLVFENTIKISGQMPSLSGSKAAAQARTQNSKTGSGGIEMFAYTAELSKETTLQIDARALYGAEDYLAQFKFTKNEVGTFEVGYKRMRTFYDGAGGFFPINNAWLPIYPRALYVDRGKFFVNATVALPQQPVYTFSYSNDTRSGRKDSTIWGDTDLTGVPIYSLASLNPVTANRKLIPAYLDLGERQENWEFALKHTVGHTNFRFAVGGNRINNLNTRSIDRYPGELKPFPAIPANPPTLVPPSLANNQTRGFDQQGFKEDAMTFDGRIETVINDKLTAYVAGRYRESDIDTTASRLMTLTIRTSTGIQNLVGGFTPGGRPPYSHNSTGDLEMTVLSGAVGLKMKPSKSLSIDAALKAEQFDTSGRNTANFVNTMVNQTTGVTTSVPLTAQSSSTTSSEPIIPEVEVRYTGFAKLSLHGSWEYRTAPGDEMKNYGTITISTGGPVVLATPSLTLDRVKETYSNTRLGGTWAPSSAFTLRGELFSKDHENRFSGYGTSAGGYYILDYDIYGARVTATVKATPLLTFTTRYVQQRGKAAIASFGYIDGDSNDSKRYHLAETITWNPTTAIYLQGNVNIVWDKTSTAYPRAGGAANDVLHNADNNYWNGSVVAGFVVDKNTDAEVQATYYKANNYQPALAAASDPYGQGGRDYSVTVGLKHKFSDRVIGSAKLGYFESDSDTTGGFSNFKGTAGYLALEYKL